MFNQANTTGCCFPSHLRRFFAQSCVFAAGFVLTLGRPISAQTFTNLYPFSALNSAFINRDGAFPAGGLVSLNNTLYGTTSQGGPAGGGTVFKLNTDGTGFTVLHGFIPANPVTGIAGDAAYPLGPLILDATTLYGTTSGGGSAANGVVFKLNVDGTGFGILHAFSPSSSSTYANSDGAAPWAGLLLDGATLYGTASRGGDAGSGTIFKLNTDGTGFTRLHSFTALDPTTQTNSDGAYPLGGLVLASNVLFGTTYRGGALATGTVFSLKIDGTGFTVLHHSDGGPRAGLILVSNVLYGTTEAGGLANGGTVFRLNTDGTGYSNLVNFAGPSGTGPWGGLVWSNGALYGTTFSAGTAAQGSLFTVNTNGTGFTTLYNFSGGADGAQPQDALVFIGSILYGTASAGGLSGSGTVFQLAPSQSATAQLTISLSGADVVLAWPASLAGASLQSTTNLVPPVTWTPLSSPPATFNNQNFVTNPISAGLQFFQLRP